jgi:hypothetical protein
MGRYLLMQTHPYESVWPAEWVGKRRSGLVIFGAVLLSLFAVATAVGAVWQTAAGDALSATVLAALAVYFGHLAGLGLHSFHGGRRRTDTAGAQEETEGLIFRYGATPTYLLSATLALTIVALAGLGVLALNQGGGQGYVIAAAMAVAIILLAAFLVVFLRLAPGQVVVGPDGIQHRGLTFTHYVPWHAVVDVAAGWANGPIIVIKTIASADTSTRNYLGRSTSGGPGLSPFNTVSGNWLAADPALLLQCVAYYLLHPEDRRELGAGTALRRLAGGTG